MAGPNEIVARLRTEGKDQYVGDVEQAAGATEDFAERSDEATESAADGWDKVQTGVNIATGALLAGGAAIEGLARKQQDSLVTAGRLATATDNTTNSVFEMAAEMGNATRTTEDIIGLMEVGRQQQVKTNEGLREYVEFWDMVGDATGENAVELAQSAKALRAVGIESAQSKDALAVFGFVQQETTASLDEFLQFVAKTGPELHDMGFTAEQTAGTFAALEHELGLGGREARQEFREGVQEAITQAEEFTDALTGNVDAQGAYTEVLERTAKATGKAVEDMHVHFDDYLDELNRQVQAEQDWRDNILRIAEGASIGVAKHLAELGPEAATMVDEVAEALKTGDFTGLDRLEAMLPALDGDLEALGLTSEQVLKPQMKTLLETLGLTEEQVATWTGKVAESNGVIKENADRFADSRTAMQEHQARMERWLGVHAGTVQSLSELAPAAIAGAIGLQMMGRGAAFAHKHQVLHKAAMLISHPIYYAHAAATWVATAATTAFGAALRFALGPVGWVIAAVGGLIAIGYVLHRNWDTITAFFRDRFASLPGPVQSFIAQIVRPIEWLVRVGHWLKDNWTDIWNVIRQTFGIAADVLTGNMEGLTKRLGSIWGSIKGMFAAPINWVIENVWNQGIRKAWNRVADLLPGLKAMREIGTIASGAERVSHAGARGVGGGLRRRTGGPIPGQGAGDRVPLWGEPGEWVINRDVSSREGDVAMAMLNSGRARIVGGDTPELGQGPGRGGGGRGSLDMLADLMGRSGIPHRLTSGYRPGDPGHHGDRNAADFAGPRPSSTPTPAMNRIFDFWAQYAGNLKELIYAGADRNIKNGRWVSPYAVAQHRNHVHVAALASQLAGGKAGAGGGAGGMIGWLRDRVAGVMDRILNPVKELIGDHLGGEGFPGMLGSVGTGLIDRVIDFVRSSADEADTAGATNVPGGPLRDVMRTLATQRGWGAHVGAWNELVSRESGWNPTAQNPTSTAYGLGQFLNSTWATVGGSKTSHGPTQLEYMARYIAGRYGHPGAALAFHDRNNWYGKGGRPIPRVPSIVGEDGPELWMPDAANRGTITPASELTGGVNIHEGAVQITVTAPTGDAAAKWLEEHGRELLDTVKSGVQAEVARR